MCCAVPEHARLIGCWLRALPFVASVTGFFSETKPALTAFYLLALRLWLLLTLMLTSVHVPYVMSEKAMRFLSWLPLHSATLLFGSVGSVALPNRARNKSPGTSGSRRSDDFTPRLQSRCPEGSVRSCRGEMTSDVELY